LIEIHFKHVELKNICPWRIGKFLKQIDGLYSEKIARLILTLLILFSAYGFFRCKTLISLPVKKRILTDKNTYLTQY
jgi:hypothetical protein